MSATVHGILSTVESSLLMSMVLSLSNLEKLHPTWWGVALMLGHLETKLHAARVLDSPTEYKQVLLVYTKKLADEGFRVKAEELVKELFGPVYWCVAARMMCEGKRDQLICQFRHAGRDDTWCLMVLCFSKRELLREVLNIFGAWLQL
jgi:protein HIRA/HIR1